MWQADGWGDMARIGILVPHNDVVPEGEFRAMAPEGISIHAARIPFGWRGERDAVPLGFDAARSMSEPPHVDDAARLLADAPVSVIAYAFTSSSYLIGVDGDQAMQARLQGRTGGIPVLVTCLSVTLGLRALRVRKLQILNPPWFTDELDQLGAAYFHAQGFEVVEASHVDLPPRGQLNVDPADVYAWITAHVAPQAEGLFVGGNGFRVVGIIQALERRLGIPALSANQALFWHALRLAHAELAPKNYGQVFEHPLPST